ncbi:MAG: Stp1/IreP family PP2C-type Ser/Thr phosphatase [Candidatus Sedimenticola sp. PURPLELP]
MNLTPIETVSRSDKGLVREVNEDSVAAMPDFSLVVLADGMGGYNSGEIASQVAVETIAAYLMPVLGSVEEAEAPLVDAVGAANKSIFAAIDEDTRYEGMATTVVLGVFGERKLHYAHVGDSRLYRLRDGRLDRLTRDHSMIQELVDQGMFESMEEAHEAGVRNNVLTRGLGVDQQLEVDTADIQIKTGDLFLFCSDGLSNMVNDHVMEEILSASDQSIESKTDQLLAMALENGGLDNVSLVLVQPQIG